VCALLVSALATSASWWQTHVVAQQLQAQVWPYLTITGTVSDKEISYAIGNDGLGPAVIRSVVLTVDGKPQQTVVEAMHALIGRIGNQAHELSTAAPGAGSVIRVGGSVTMFRLTSAVLAPKLARQAGRVTLRVCYCSIVGGCWLKESQQSDPRIVASCPDAGADQLREAPLGAPPGSL
ncbi:MAG: hypothetical protein QOI11_3663, partial [Candidatus Eremiobacteraeota bacterium]|nr:hypothetical protein [Candidatus Eremiobacteraeota bacterium]